MITKHQAEAEIAFSAGNYSRAAFMAETDELRGAALAMVGALEESIPLLQSHTTARAYFCRALAYWGLGDTAAAQAALAEISTHDAYGPPAAKLARFMGCGKIRLLVQGRYDPRCPEYDLISALRKIPYAEVIAVGYSPHSDVVIDYTSSFDDVLKQLPVGWIPDLYLNHLVEDNPPPYGIETASFPTLFHTQDYDRHIQHAHGYLMLCDAIVALGAADHEELSALSGRPTYVYPLLLGIDVANERCSTHPRTKDVFISGSLFNNGMGKARCVFDIAQLPDEISIDLVEGFTSANEYYAQLGQAKATFTYVNRWGALNGRAVEAISVGTCALVQEGTELQLYVSPEQGAIPFNEDNFLDVLQEVTRDWDARYAAYGQAGVNRVKQVFNFTRCIQRYFNFLVTLACQVDVSRRSAPAHAVKQPRYPTRSPWRIPFHFFDTDLYRMLRQFSQHVSQGTDYLYLDAFGESRLYSYIFLTRAVVQNAEVEAEASAVLGEAQRVYKQLTQQYPERLAPRFNYARILFEAKDYVTAAKIFTDILVTPNLRFYASDALFWKEMQEIWFDYDVLMDAGVAFRKSADAAELVRIERAIRESSAFYLGSLVLIDAGADLALEVLNILGEIGFAPALLLRAKLRLQVGDASGGWQDVESALQRRPWDTLQLDTAFFETVQRQGCPAKTWVNQHRQLATRMRKVRTL